MRPIPVVALTMLLVLATDVRSEDYYYPAGGLTSDANFNPGMRISEDGMSLALRHVWTEFDNEACKQLGESVACRSFQGVIVAAPVQIDADVSIVREGSEISCREEIYGTDQKVSVCVAKSGSMKTKTLSTLNGDVISISISEADVVQTFVCAGDRRFSLRERNGKAISSS